MVNGVAVFKCEQQQPRFREILGRFEGATTVAKDGIKIVEKALDRGFASKGAKVFFSTDRSDYKDFIRIFVVSDFFRRKSEKERLAEIFSILEENGAKDAIAKISLCVAMTNREYDREFGKSTWIARPGEVYHDMKRKPRVSRLSRVGGRS